MMHERTINYTVVKGLFPLPMGVRFLNREVGDYPKTVEVSTVCREGAHLEDPLGICEAEHGYETMVFLAGCSFFSVFTAEYKTRREAANGHRAVVRKLLAGKLPLAIQVAHYRAWDVVDPKTKAA